MEEVICPHCGKANLSTDRFCHQCLRPIENPEDDKKESVVNDVDIPEWLKRIRELKKVDEDREKDKEKWRQQTLFGQSGESQKQKQNITEKKNLRTHAETGKPDPTIKTPSAPPSSSPHPSQSNELTDKSLVNPATDQKTTLPEGFTPFDD